MDKPADSQRPASEEIVLQSGKPNPRAELNFEKAFQDFKDFLIDNKERNNKNTDIQKKRNGAQPYSPKKLKAAGQGWRSNRPTGFMQSILARLFPPYKQMVDQLSYLTYSHFPNDRIGTEAQQDKFRKNITDCIRTWKGHSDLVSQIIDENFGFGYCSAGCIDKYQWKPVMFRGDEAMFPVGCPQESGKVEKWGLKKNLRVGEAIEILSDLEVAKAAGWRVDNLINKLNNATDEFKDSATYDNARVYQDLIRENNAVGSFTSSLKVLDFAHVFAKSPTGGVSHYIMDQKDGTPLFFQRDKWIKMENFLALFSAEVGDRTLQSSRGAGRALFNTHVSVEQARNLATDALHLSGLIVMKKAAKLSGVGQTQTTALSVNHPFAILGDGYEALEKVKFEFDSEAFFALDEHATTQAEILVGAFMPGDINKTDGSPETASAVNYRASINAQIRAGALARFADQYFPLVDIMQRQICHPEVVKVAEAIWNQTKDGNDILIYDKDFFAILNDAGAASGFVLAEFPDYLDEDAVECCVKMFADGLSTQQILILANSSSKANVDDAIASQSGILDIIVARYSADPVVDTVELKRRDIAANLGASTAERLMNVDLNPLSDVKQVRTQLSELATMLSGNSTPVDKTDNDLLHLQTVQERIEPMLRNPAISPLASSQAFLKLVSDHAKAHIQSAMVKGAKASDFAPFSKMIDTIEELIKVPPMDSTINSILGSSALPAAGTLPAAGDKPAGDEPPRPGSVPPTNDELLNPPIVPQFSGVVLPGKTIASAAAPPAPVPPRNV